MWLNYKVRISKQMHGYFKPVVYIFRAFGIFPFSTERTKSELFFKWSPWYALYSYTIASLLVGATFTEAVHGLFFKGGVKFDIINNTDNFVWLFNATSFCLATITITFVTPKRFRQLCECIQRINEVDDIEINSQKLKFDFPAIILIMHTAAIGISISFIHFSHDTFSAGMYGLMTRVLPFFLHVLIGDMMQYMIRLIIHILAMKFDCLHKTLNREYQNIKKGQVVVCKPTANEITASTPQTTNCNAEKIKVLNKIYLKLMEAAEILDDYFGVIILIVMASSLLQLISTPYHLILSLQGKRRGFGETMRRLLKFSEQLIRVLILIEPMYQCTLKIQETGREISNLLSLKIKRDYRKQVDAFSWCVCFKQLQFSACGFFDIDRFLLSTIVGTVTTYVCILLQAAEEETQ